MNKLKENIQYLKSVQARLARAAVPSAPVEAERLIRHFGGMDRVEFFTGEKALLPGTKKTIEKALRARLAGEPLSYLLREADFFGRRFYVTKDTLIPRPETEILVEEAIRILDRHTPAASSPEVLDIGTGTGCIAVSLTLARPDCRMTALDVSGSALQAARKNVDFYGLGNKIGLVRSDLFGAFEGGREGTWDIIVSNPPYVPEEDFPSLSREVLSEPRLALDGGPEGLRVLAAILDEAPYYLKKKGWLLLEIGKGQADVLAGKISREGVYTNLKFVKDYAGIERVLIAQHG
ncbi:MAG: peptide chain release factor N(5)-glutamine methyltransferase [Candidatus Omnitrophota bacterium]